MTGTRHSHGGEEEADGPTEQELIDNFVAWVEAFIHDIEAVPDEDNLSFVRLRTIRASEHDRRTLPITFTAKSSPDRGGRFDTLGSRVYLAVSNRCS